MHAPAPNQSGLWPPHLPVSIVNIFVGPSGLVVQVGPVVLALSVAGFAYYAFQLWKHRHVVTVVQANIRLGAIGDITLRPSHDDVQVAHQAWVELAARKAGLPFDEEHDVILEVYNSWYQLFAELRRLAKQIPADKVRRSKETQKLVRLLVEAMNLGLRPHLTKWQAKFRRWYDGASRKNDDLTPQEIQRIYPHYTDLVEDLKKVSENLVQYTDFIKEVAHGTAKR